MNNDFVGLLKDIGINAGLLISGLFGSLLTIGKNSTQKIGPVIISIMGGAASANYLTPVIVSILKIPSESNHIYSIAFMLGFLGLKGVEMISHKLFDTVEEQHIVIEGFDPGKTIKRSNRKTKKHEHNT